MSPSNGLQNGGGKGDVGGGNGLSYIEHYVSKFDTLAGVAIKYGVEVADIKRMNGLATDLQMFALQMLRIPLPGRHPPSPVPSEPAKLREKSGERRPPRIGQSAMKEPLQSLRLKPPKQKISPAMTILQKYYGLDSSSSRDTSGETEMAIYTSSTSDHSRDEWLPKPSPIPNHHSKSTNSSFDLLTGNDEVSERQKADVDNGGTTPERIFKEGNNSNGSNGSGSSSNGKAFSMRPKSASRASLFSESDSGWLDSIPVGFGESIFTDGLSGVRKSSSASSLREQEKYNSAATAWPTISKPIFDGLPIPITGRRSKTALD
ncbi:unnamed protein product [Vicia faba]|uniref:LysM domain-containing protein n=1 Tax=Vicia faba TaxID=3906 RepID=A0AAV0Z608_VICFA|nr:unnamed protein product [Vicia faba]